jgi:hypothetical protein
MLITDKIPYPRYTKKGKTNLLSMNIFRNLHHFAANKVKQDYQEVVAAFVQKLPRFTTISVQYKLFFKGNRKKDINNYGFPVDKFLMDALVKADIIEDDNYLYVTKTTVEIGGFGKEVDSYVEVTIRGEIDEDWITHKCSMQDEAERNNDSVGSNTEA